MLYDNSTDDLFLEVNHGPFLIDNNLLLSETAVRNWSEGGAYVHNLVGGDVILRPVLERSTPFQKPHSTAVVGLSPTKGGDDRWYNNLFVGYSGLSSYDEGELTVWMDGNVFLNGSHPSKYETDPVVGSVIEVAVIEKRDGVYLSFYPLEVLEDLPPTSLVTTGLLGRARLAGQEYTHPNGEPLTVDTDYFGIKRDMNLVVAGPFGSVGRAIKVWEK